MNRRSLLAAIFSAPVALAAKAITRKESLDLTSRRVITGYDKRSYTLSIGSSGTIVWATTRLR